MIETPICDFVRRYAQDHAVRMHMPGHKGVPLLGMEPLDITEIDGADSLYEADGIICESEANASKLFGCPTFYSTEGSSQCIRAMLYLASLYAQSVKRPLTVAAGRNAHKTFLSAAALLDFDVQWLEPAEGESYLSCGIDAETLEKAFETAEVKPTAVYLTSPDYLGNQVDLKPLAEVCHRRGALLLVDNAHGAYLKFLEKSAHPIDLGADLCCDSAHKTLPALTGAAYLHISPNQAWLADFAKQALVMFGSTSPSYLILQSLDAVNRYLDDGYGEKLRRCAEEVNRVREALRRQGFLLRGAEPLKITIEPKNYGYTGIELAKELLKQNIAAEFSDPDELVLMITPENSPSDFQKLIDALKKVVRRAPVESRPPRPSKGETVLSIRQAAMALSEEIPSEEAEGRILASANVGCPPAVPIVVCGERIDRQAIRCFEYYGISRCSVVRA